MTEPSLRDLPPIALQRLERARQASVATSLASVPSAAGLSACGFTPVGEVMGCIVLHLGWAGFGGCGWGGYGFPPTFTLTRRSGGYFAFAPYLDAIQHGWDTAIGRMRAEARALGGDGVVGVTLTESTIDGENREFVALGTAVRSTGSTHLPEPFTTTLAGDDLAKLFLGGYAPAHIIVAIALALRHDDWATIQSTSAFAPNMEVPGYTDLVHTVRREARVELQGRAARDGATGAVLDGPMGLHIYELEVGEGHRDHLAQAALVGSGIVALGGRPRQAPPPLAMLPLRDSTGTRRRAGGVQHTGIEQTS